MQIKNIYLKHGLALAPMAGVTDRAFRRLCVGMGCEYAVTEMVSAKAICYESEARPSAPARSAPLARIDEGIPTAIQIFGSDPTFMARAAKMLSELTYRGASGVRPAAIDINMGCPVKKVVSCGEGSALMKTPELAADIVAAVKGAVDIPVTVKIRAGWDRSSVNAPEMAKRLEAAGADAICVHGRTREQFYAPSSDNRVIAEVKRAVSVPVFGNGDINTAADALRMLDETGCDGLMIARGSMGDPWLFAEIAAALEGREYTSPELRERIETAYAYAEALVEENGQGGVVKARGQLAWYITGIRGAAAVRAALNAATELSELKNILFGILEDE